MYCKIPFQFIIILFLYSCAEEPSILITPNTVILEEDEPKAKSSIQLTFKNDGRIPVHRVVLRPACACYEILSVTTPLAPQEKRTLSFDFLYPGTPGPFSETIRVLIEGPTGKQSSTQLLVVTGVARPTLVIAPPSLDLEILPKTQTLVSFFEFDLLDHSQFQEAQVTGFSFAEVKNPTDFVEVSLSQGINPSQLTGRCQFNLYQLAQSGHCAAVTGFIRFHLQSDQKFYDIDYPVSLCPKSVRIFPEIITLSSENPGEVRVEIPHEIHLEKIVLLPLGITIPFQEEVMWSDPYSSTYVVRCGWVNTRLPAGFRFGTLSFQFSNGTEQKKGFLVKGSEEKAARS